jgi:hypothetical protein
MLKNLVKTVKRRAQFGLAKVNPVAAIGRRVDNYRLDKASKRTRSAINKTGAAFSYAKLGPGYERGYDDKVKKMQKTELQSAGKTMQQVSENNRKRLERLNNIR